jgi:hypothetical protein
MAAPPRGQTVRVPKFILLMVVLTINTSILLKYLTQSRGDMSPYTNGEVINRTVSHPVLDPDVPYKANQPPIFGSNNNSSFSVVLRPFPNRKIGNIRILGERHSGTTYLTRYLQQCFSERQIMDLMVRTKHWFQPSPGAIIKAASIAGKEGLADSTDFIRPVPGQLSWWDMAHEPTARQTFSNSFVIYLVRDPYQWIEAMRRKPWHWPNHLRILPRNQSEVAAMKYDAEQQTGKLRRTQQTGADYPKQQTIPTDDLAPEGPVRIQKSYIEYETLDWTLFVQAPLRLTHEDVAAAGSVKICSKGFPKGTLSPCLQNISYVPPLVSHIPRSFLRNLPFDVNHVVYELQSDGEAFNNPLALRAAKIRNILGLAEVWDLGGFVVVRYEDLLDANDNGAMLTTLVTELEKMLDVSSHCQPHRNATKSPYSLPNEFVEWIGQHAQWETEGYLGYTRKAIDKSRFL